LIDRIFINIVPMIIDILFILFFDLRTFLLLFFLEKLNAWIVMIGFLLLFKLSLNLFLWGLLFIRWWDVWRLLGYLW
jgi:hypothetical protein